ncbi:MAG: hypothetical protein PHU46_12375 [Rhodocyclaceae bacterium]|nr:hypothetical protein [Rhodocyclaceae bacterium]
MTSLLAAFAVIFGLMALTISVDRLYKRFAARNPERGPFRDKDKGCQSCKACVDLPTCDAGKRDQ